MKVNLKFIMHIAAWVLFIPWIACDQNKKSLPQERGASAVPFNELVAQHLDTGLTHALQKEGRLDDTTRLIFPSAVDSFYANKNFQPSWMLSTGKPRPQADTFIQWIHKSLYWGLFPEHYHMPSLQVMHRAIVSDTSGEGASKDAALWMRYELMLTDAFFHICRDLDIGRLGIDSTFMRADSIFKYTSYTRSLDSFLAGHTLTALLAHYEPSHKAYHQLKKALHAFLDTANFDRVYTYVQYPFKDSLIFIQQLTKRLQEEGIFMAESNMVDTAQLRKAILLVQKQRRLTEDGKYGPQLISSLNRTPRELLRCIALNLDRYKHLPQQMPERYLWVNIPGYYMELREADSLMLTSKVVVGKPKTRTPLLFSRIGNMVTYPQWTIPNSIIVKEILPALRRNPGYLSKKGYMLSTWQGEEVDPHKVDWTKYTNAIPFKIIQGSGDDNALGVIKFNFANPYDVYMHDTNQRYYFSQSYRALSHGCIRVQEWKKLSETLLSLDSASVDSHKMVGRLDSLQQWLQNKERRVVHLKNRLPLFIRYFTATVHNGKLIFFDDIYGEDSIARQKMLDNQ